MDVFTLKGIPALGPIGPIGVGIFQECLISKVGVIYGLYMGYMMLYGLPTPRIQSECSERHARLQT